MDNKSINTPKLITTSSGEASIRNLPVSIFASVMGLSGLALAWRLAHGELGAPAFIGEALGAFAAAVFVLISVGYLIKIAKHPEVVHAEFRHPVAGNFFGSIVISILLLAAVAEPYSATIANVIWTIGGLATFLICFVVLSRVLKGEVEASHIAPAWLIPCVATLDIPVTGGHMLMSWAPELDLFAGAVGAVLGLVLFALIVSRLVHHKPLATAMTPSLMILVAPFAVGFLAYSNIIGGIDRFGSLLFYFALFMFAVIAPKVFRPSVKFSPAWWAVSFPMAALVNAALKFAEFHASTLHWSLAIVLLGLLTVLLIILTVRTAQITINGKLFT